MKILIVGSGGREAALAWKLAQSPRAPEILVAGKNDGICPHAKCVNVDSDMVGFCQREQVDLVVIGPEVPLMEGLADRLRAGKVKTFGPSAAAAQLEGSKIFTRRLCAEYDIPSPKWQGFDDRAAAKEYVATQNFPIVIKADGLAAGKGVVIAENKAEAVQAIENVFHGKFGAKTLLIEECMQGEEASFFVLCDGKTAKFFGTAQDHKRAFDGDQGPNTGGMGAFSPAIILTPAQEEEVMKNIITPTLKAMRKKNMPFSGVLYAGLMLTQDGVKLVEFNTRFGDPECQLLMMRLKSDLLEILLACVEGRLASQEILWRDDYAALVVMAAKGYPADYRKGSIINGLDAAQSVLGAELFHAATLYQNGVWLANGGRVLNLAGLGKTLEEAIDTAYAAIDKIEWEDGFYRKDIGKNFV